MHLGSTVMDMDDMSHANGTAAAGYTSIELVVEAETRTHILTLLHEDIARTPL